MALTLILICLVVQRWLQFDSHTRQYDWFYPYFSYIRRHFEQKPYWKGWRAVLLTLLPAWLIYLLIAFIVYQAMGVIFYYLLALVVLWYCIDARRLNIEEVRGRHLRQVLSLVYERLFAIIFWLVVLGSPGVVLYTLVLNLRAALEDGQREKSKDLYAITVSIERVLDWVPLRLMGIAYALIGHFAPTFKYWYQHLWTGLDYTREEAATCALLAFDWADEKTPLSEPQLNELNTMLNRTLMVWLVVIALFTIGAWIG